MEKRRTKQDSAAEQDSASISRRRALTAMLGLPGALIAADPGAPVRMAISESLVTDVNLNDARAAMTIWLKRMSADLGIGIEVNPKIFETTQEIVRRARANQVDVVALNVVEYRQIADVLDSTQIMTETGAAGAEPYLLLVKRKSGIERLNQLRGHRLTMLKAPKMCVATAWLSAILDEGHLGPPEPFFGSVSWETKSSRVVLPVFFDQAEACVTSKTGFDTMCELNPQVGKDLTAIASSSAMVVTFCVFHKNYHGANREKFTKIYSGLGTSVAARQVATLFQFDDLTLQNAGCLQPALAVLEKAERARSRTGAGTKWE